MPRIRVHQHVNPLAPYFRFVSKPLDLEKLFANPNLRLHLDIGSARGRFLLRMAGEFPKQNFLGLEIREALVKEANRLAREQNLENLHYEFTNASLSLGSLLKHFPREILRDVTIQFPDPWHKRKHAKRRMLTEETVVVLAQYLAEAGKVFVQTDVDFLAEEMLALFRQNESFLEIDSEANPFPIKTEREIAAEAKGLRIYRRIFVKLKR